MALPLTLSLALLAFAGLLAGLLTTGLSGRICAGLPVGVTAGLSARLLTLLFALALTLTGLLAALARLGSCVGLTALAGLVARLARLALPLTGLRLLTIGAGLRFAICAGVGARLALIAAGAARLILGTGATLTLLRLRDLALQLIREAIEFGLGEPELLRFVAKHFLRGAFHAATEFIDLATRALAGLTRLRHVAFAQHFPRDVQRLAALVAGIGLLEPV
ncbi:MAG TPA: hypothetical protein VHN79_12110, partial [Lacunisphaera sp.]|nr:hypothetical protein [Lacunisphaera sp.]